jgi:hypothetical protein
LYFQALGGPGSERFAVVWVAKEDCGSNQKNRSFNGQFLGFSDPWRDQRLTDWKGYSETWYFDNENRRVAAGGEGVRSREMIPLGFYALSHPRTPFLLVDFRNPYRAKKTEMFRRTTAEVIAGVLGIRTPWNWSWFAAESGWKFFSGRRGAAVVRSARLTAYAEARVYVNGGHDLQPEFAQLIGKHLNHLALNPMESSDKTENSVAMLHYKGLKAFAERPDGLPKKIAHERRKELLRENHSAFSKRVGTLRQTFGIAAGHGHTESEELVALDRSRRRRFYKESLRRSLDANYLPSPLDPANASYLLRELAGIDPGDPDVVRYADRLFINAAEGQVRLDCLKVLRESGAPTSKLVLVRIAKDAALDSRWRALANLYLQPAEPAELSASGF